MTDRQTDRQKDRCALRVKYTVEHKMLVQLNLNEMY